MNREAEVVKQIEDSILLKRYLQSEVRTIAAIADMLVQVLRRGNKVLLFGNGGSWRDA